MDRATVEASPSPQNWSAEGTAGPAALVPRHLRGWRTHALLVGPALLAFAGQLSGLTTLFSRDTGLYFLPHKALVAQALHEGRLPQWNPWEYGGIPLLADPNFNVFHPLSLFTHLLPLPWGFSVFVFACALGAAYGARALGRALGLSHEGAIACGLAYAWSGQSVSLLQAGQGVAGCFIPWLLAAALRSRALPTRQSVVEVALAAALVCLSGTPEVGACGFLLAGLLVVARAPRQALPGLGLFALGCTLGALLAAVQLFPTAAYLGASSRGGAGFDYAQAIRYSLRPLRLLELALPFATGAADAPGVSSWCFPVGDARYVDEIYAGTLVLGLSLLGLRGPGDRARRAWLLVGSLLLGAVALGPHLPLHRLLWEAWPAVRSVRFPEKLIVPLSLALAASAGAGWEALRLRLGTPPQSPRASELTLIAGSSALALSVAALVLPWTWPALLAALEPARRHSLLATLAPSLGLELLLSGLALIVFGRGLRGHLPPARAATGLATLLALELLVPAARLWQAVPREELARSPLVATLLADAGAPSWTFRISSEATGLSNDDLEALGDPSWSRPRKLFWVRHAALNDSWPALSGLFADRGYSGLTSGGLRALYQRSNGRAVLDALSVRYGLAFGTKRSAFEQLGFVPVQSSSLPPALQTAGQGTAVRVFRNPTPGPRLRLVGHALSAPGRSPLTECAGAVWLPPADLANLPPSIPLVLSCAALEALASPGSPGTARIVEYLPERVVAEVDAERPTLVLLNDAWAPGWTASLDGAPVPVLAAEGAFRAVAVPAGKHDLVWSYRAPGLTAGAWTSLCAALALGLLAFRRPRPACT